jgi:D-amino-acid dehydrogenase
MQSVVVIGGGIAGISTALYLADAGIKVTCIETNSQVAQETSYLNGSLACASLTQPWCSRGNLIGFLTQPFQDKKSKDGAIVVLWKAVWNDADFWKWVLNFSAFAMSNKLYQKLFAASYMLSSYSLDCMEELDRRMVEYKLLPAKGLAEGTIQLFPTRQEQTRQYAALSDTVKSLDVLSAHEVPQLDSVLQQPDLFLGGALLSRQDRSYNIHDLCVSMKCLAEKQCVLFVTGQSVSSLTKTDSAKADSELAVQYATLCDGSKVYADAFVVAAGNHSNGFAKWAGDGMHSWPVRGFALEVPVAERAVSAPAEGATSSVSTQQPSLRFNVVDDPRRIYIAPLTAGKVRLSGYCELGASIPDKTLRVDYAPAFALLEQARQLLPAGYLVPAEDTRIRVHTCWRPQTPDDLPVVGRSARCRNLYYNSGHGHLGLTRAVGCAKLLSQVMTQGKVTESGVVDMRELAPDRFRLWSTLRRILK